jgi:glutamate formiminotransferase
VLECVVNLSEGRDPVVLARAAATAGPALLDLHADPDHHRAVLTIAGDDAGDAVRRLAAWAVTHLDLRTHSGAHPRLGVVDVVPWVDLDDARAPWTPASVTSRDAFAAWAGDELGLPCFLYGPERTLPDVRRRAWRDLGPDCGPAQPHPTAGTCAVGARGALIAYNLWIAGDRSEAVRVATALRRPGLRALGLQVGTRVQVSCNLVDPYDIGPAEVFDLAAGMTAVTGAELVGLLPRDILDAIPSERWSQLDLAPDRTIEVRLSGGA